MNPKEIVAGHTYHDGKFGLRRVISKSEDFGEVRYVILACKHEVQGQDDLGYTRMVGDECACTIIAFSRWAKSGYDELGAERVSRAIQAKRTKLSPTEEVFMRSVLAEAGEIGPGSLVSYGQTEGRVVGGLEKKGILKRSPGGDEFEISLIGQVKLVQINRPTKRFDIEIQPQKRPGPKVAFGKFFDQDQG